MYDSYLKRRSQIAIDRVIEAFVLELPETDNDDLLALHGLLKVWRVRAFVVGPQGPNLLKSEIIEYFCLHWQMLVHRRRESSRMASLVSPTQCQNLRKK